MAVTSIWRVTGSSSIGRVVEYVKNPLKTTNPDFEKDKKKDNEKWLTNVIHYAMNDAKTVVRRNKEIFHDEKIPILRQFVSGVNCLPDTAKDEMTALKLKFDKMGGVVAYHGYQSFAPGEGTPEMVHEIGVKLAERLWGARYQVVVATHLDRVHHLHNHFVLNTVSFVDGIKYNRSKADYWDMRNASDALCREYGLSVIETQTGFYGKRYDEWRDEKAAKGADGRATQTRDTASGKTWQTDGTANGLSGGKKRYIIRAHYNGNFNPRRRIRLKFTGFIALYFYYLRLIGYFPRKRQPSAKQIYFLYREDIGKMREVSREIRFLSEHHIATDEQLFAHIEEVTPPKLQARRPRTLPR